MRLKLQTLALFPICLAQGIYVKKKTIRLPEPTGPRIGQIGGQGQPLSLMILGDSAAAGVGVLQQQDALLGQLLHQLQPDYQIHYALHAKTGRTTAGMIKVVQNLAQQPTDVVITSLGVNDVTQLKNPKIWIKQQQQLLKLIKDKFTPKIIIFTGVPHMQEFPALPRPLSWLFGQYAQQMNQLLDQLSQRQNNLHILHFDLKQYQALNLKMAEDGFHPSKEIYCFWAKQIVQIIQQMNCDN